MNDIVETKTHAVGAVSTGRLAALAAQAKEAATAERPNVSKIRLKSGVISYGGQAVKDNVLDCIVLVATYRNTFYHGRYDPDAIVNPTCFSLAESDDGMVPDPIVSTPINKTCTGCEYREWESDLNGGRGKACKETRRLVLLPASVLSDPDPVKAIQGGELAILDLPVTSVKNYSQYVNVLAASIGLPIWVCVTAISAKPDAKTQFKVLFTGIRAAGETDEVLDALEAKKLEALRIGLLGYDSSTPLPTEEEIAAAEAAAKASPKGKKKF